MIGNFWVIENLNLCKFYRFYVCADYEDYIRCQDKVSKTYEVSDFVLCKFPNYIFRIAKNGSKCACIISHRRANSAPTVPFPNTHVKFGTWNPERFNCHRRTKPQSRIRLEMLFRIIDKAQ